MLSRAHPPGPISAVVARCLNRVGSDASLVEVSQRGATDAPEGGLDDRARAILDFEREAWKLQVPKERAIRERFGFSPARYHQLLHRIVDGPHALRYDPMLVRRLRRIREIRRSRRTADRLGFRL
ncbi:MAG: DUF3263 domain-containing protein [Actinobacteria bacterium]|nr:MAG: DUF3263 domain-containing protein [Actinomycetota bacterium]